MDLERNINDQTDFFAINNQADQQRDSQLYPASTRTPLTRNEILLIILLCLSMLVTSMSFAIIAVFFPLAAYKKGVTPSEVGYVFAIFCTGTFFFSPVAGALITRIGTRKVLVTSLFTSSVIALFFAFTDYYRSKAPFLATCLVLRFIQGLGVVGIQTSTLTVVAHQFRSRVGVLTGFLEMSNGIGFSFSAGLGGILYQYGGYGAPFYFMFTYSILITLLCWKFIPKTEAHMESNMSVTKSLSLLKHPSIYYCAIAATVLSTDIAFMSSYTSSFLKQAFDIADYKIGLILSFSSVAYTVITSPVGLFIDKTGLVHFTIIFGLFFRGMAHLMFAPSILFQMKPILSLAIGGQATLGISTVLAFVPIYKYFQLQAGKSGYDIHTFNTSTMISTLVTATQALGSVVGPVLSGQLIQHIGYDWTYNFFGILVSSTALIVLIDYLSSRKICCKRMYNSSERAPLVINSEVNHEYTE